MQANISLNLADEADTLRLGRELANECSGDCTIFLKGELGAGKTTLVRGFLRGLGFLSAVKSPTYTFVESYEIEHRSIFHFDLYRLKDPDELEWIGIRDYFSKPAIRLIEWPEKAGTRLPTPDLICTIAIQKQDRFVTISAETKTGLTILDQLKKYQCDL